MINKSLIPTFGLNHDYHTFAKSLLSESLPVSLLFEALVDTSIPTHHLNFIILVYYLAAMTYNQVHYFRVNHLADFTQNGHTKIPVG